MVHTMGDVLEAFCPTCPSAEDLTHMLKAYGFELVFHMDRDASSQYEQLPPIPAQFHFQDRHGNEVIFLAGRDTDLDGVQLPEHASRFWLNPGADRVAYQGVAHVLSVRWSFTWQSSWLASKDVA